MLQMMRQQIWMLKQMTVAADWVDQPGTEASRRWMIFQCEIIKVVRSENDSPLSLLFPAISGLRNKALAYRQRLLAARLALRVVRYRARKQRFLMIWRPSSMQDFRMCHAIFGTGAAPTWRFAPGDSP